MTDKQIFGLVVRLVGLFLAIYALADFWTAVGCWIDSSGTHAFSGAVYLLAGLFSLPLGALLIRGLWLVRFAYGQDSSN